MFDPQLGPEKMAGVFFVRPALPEAVFYLNRVELVNFYRWRKFFLKKLLQKINFYRKSSDTRVDIVWMNKVRMIRAGA